MEVSRAFQKAVEYIKETFGGPRGFLEGTREFQGISEDPRGLRSTSGGLMGVPVWVRSPLQS